MGQPRSMRDRNIPRVRRPDDIAPLGTTVEPRTRRRRQLGSRQISVAVVDDDPAVRDSLAVLLEIHDFQTQPYASGIEFLADQSHDRLGCLIVDQNMPTMDGLGVLLALRDEDIVVPTILITCQLDAAITERAKKLGVNS